MCKGRVEWALGSLLTESLTDKIFYGMGGVWVFGTLGYLNTSLCFLKFFLLKSGQWTLWALWSLLRESLTEMVC